MAHILMGHVAHIFVLFLKGYTAHILKKEGPYLFLLLKGESNLLLSHPQQRVLVNKSGVYFVSSILR